MVIAVLYYTGIMPYFIKKISWIMEITCDVSGPEAIVCVGNIFVGQTESPLLIKPFIQNLTQSELFVVMVSGLGKLKNFLEVKKSWQGKTGMLFFSIKNNLRLYRPVFSCV